MREISVGKIWAKCWAKEKPKKHIGLELLSKGELRAVEHKLFAAGIRKKYPLAAQRLCQRAQRYNEGVARAQEYAKQGRVLIVSPDDTCGVDTLKRNKESLQRLYQKGYHDAKKIKAFVQN